MPREIKVPLIEIGALRRMAKAFQTENNDNTWTIHIQDSFMNFITLRHPHRLIPLKILTYSFVHYTPKSIFSIRGGARLDHPFEISASTVQEPSAFSWSYAIKWRFGCHMKPLSCIKEHCDFSGVGRLSWLYPNDLRI